MTQIQPTANIDRPTRLRVHADNTVTVMTRRNNERESMRQRGMKEGVCAILRKQQATSNTSSTRDKPRQQQTPAGGILSRASRYPEGKNQGKIRRHGGALTSSCCARRVLPNHQEVKTRTRGILRASRRNGLVNLESEGDSGDDGAERDGGGREAD